MKLKNYLVWCHVLAVILLATMLVFAPASQAVRACEPTLVLTDYIPPTPIPMDTQVAGVIQDAQIVLDGTVLTWVPSSNMDSILTVRVERYLKGHGPRIVKISGYFWDCPPNFAFFEGSRSIFFVNGDPASTKPLQVRTWYGAQEAVVTSVRNFTGQEPVAPDVSYNVLWWSLLIVIVLGAALFMRYRRTRSWM